MPPATVGGGRISSAMSAVTLPEELKHSDQSHVNLGMIDEQSVGQTTISSAPNQPDQSQTDPFGSSQPTSSTFHQNADDDDDFGDFGEAPQSTIQKDVSNDMMISGSENLSSSYQQSSSFGVSAVPNLAASKSNTDSDPFGHLDQSVPTSDIMDDTPEGTSNSLPAQPKPAPMDEGVDDDFGDFGEAVGTISDGRPTENSLPSDMDPFGHLGGSVDTPLAPLGSEGPSSHASVGDAKSAGQGPEASNVDVVEDPADDDENGFGGFGEAPAGVGASQAPEVASQAADTGLGGFGAALATNIGTKEPMISEEKDDDFGGFGEAPVPASSLGQSQESVVGAMDSDDPFGHLGSSPQAPLPPLGTAEPYSSASVSAGESQEADNSPPVVEDIADDDEDDFGGFGEAPATSSGVQESADAMENADTDFGGFGEAPVPAPSLGQSQESVVGAMNSDDPFGHLGDSQQAPLPPLGTAEPYSSASVSAGESQEADNSPPVVEDVADDDEDDFGGFGEAPATGSGIQQPADTMENADTDFGGFGEAPTPAPPSEEAEDDFGGFGEAPTPAPISEVAEDDFGGFGEAPTPAPPSEEAEDDFGGFGESPDPAPSNGQSQEASVLADALDSDDPFGHLGGSEQASLPALGSADPSSLLDSVVGEGRDADPIVEDIADDDEDDFGKFGEASATGSGIQQPADTMENAVTDIGGFGEAPTPAPSLGHALEASLDAMDSDDPFGHLGGSDQAPLPTLGSAGPSAARDGQENAPPVVEDIAHSQDDDDFGGFGEAQVPITSDGACAEENFDGSGHASLPSHLQPEKTDFGAVKTSSNADYLGSEDEAVSDDPFPREESGAFFSAASSVSDYVSADEGLMSQEKELAAYGISIESPNHHEKSSSLPIDDNGSIKAEEVVDDFGDFDGAQASGLMIADGEADHSAQEFGLPNSQDRNGSAFGFDSAEMVSSAPIIPTDQSDDFGDFGSANFNSTSVHQETAADHETSNAAGPEDDDFGTFDSVEIPPPASDQPLDESQRNEAKLDDDDDDFGTFETVQAPDPEPNQPQPSLQKDINLGDGEDEDDDFRTFETVEAPDLETSKQSEASAISSAQEEEDDFGSFDSVSAPATNETKTRQISDDAPGIENGEDDDFGSFDSVKASGPSTAPVSMPPLIEVTPLTLRTRATFHRLFGHYLNPSNDRTVEMQTAKLPASVPLSSFIVRAPRLWQSFVAKEDYLTLVSLHF